MKKLLALFLATVMLLSAVCVSAFAANPEPKYLTVTNAVDGTCGATVELSWQKNGESIQTGMEIIIKKSYDDVNYEQVAEIANNVEKTTSYTYNCVLNDNGKTIYFRVQYGWSATTVFNYATVSVNIKANAVQNTAEEYNNLLLQGLADPKYTKKTTKYNGTTFVVGTKSVWDCKLYTLTATVTKVSGKIATFAILFKSKIPSDYMKKSPYAITAISNYPGGFKSVDGEPGKTFTVSVNTAATDPLDTSSPAGGMQFLKIRVYNIVKEDLFPLDSGNRYASTIVKNRKVYPENSTNFSQVYIDDTYTLGYYIKPTYKLATNSFAVSKKSIYLGIYAFNGTVQYKAAGAKSWKQKAIAKNKKLYLTGLKANTSYSIRVLCKLPYKDIESGKNKYVVDIVGKQITLTTSLTSKPLLKQVKISSVKYGKYTRKGYWEKRSDGTLGNWHPAETFYTAKYKVTVKLRKVPAKAKGLCLKAGGATEYKSGRKSTYTFTMTYQSKKPVKGKKLSCNLYYSGNTINKKAVGIGPGRKINYKLKNSTTNYKK